jgi:hypothetical protein
MSVGNWETEYYNSVLEIKFNFWENTNGNQTFILDSHRPFICHISGLSFVRILGLLCACVFYCTLKLEF